MKPFYDEDGITIYHGDCREIAPSLQFDVIVTDPPYGIAYSPGGGGRGWSGNGTGWGKSFKGKNVVRGDDEPFDPTWLILAEKPTVLWGANHYANKLPPSAAWLVWDKRRGLVENSFADCEMAWTNLGRPARLLHHLWYGVWRDSQEERYHPTQKPLAVMSWCLGQVPDGIVLDPYMGSGSTLRAAKDLGKRAIGIEIEEKYCEIAVQRLAQGVLEFS